jgi:tRNA threonylcarbamoyladenosine biosynthesis protein TsaE
MHKQSITLQLADEQATIAFATQLAGVISPQTVIFFEGDLGSGKTTFVRALLRARGITGAIKSPTYTLLEPYRVADTDWCHCDLYRLGTPEELEMLGLRDYHAAGAVLLIEWPGQGQGYLPDADLLIKLSLAGSGRTCLANAYSQKGAELLQVIREWKDA